MTDGPLDLLQSSHEIGVGDASHKIFVRGPRSNDL
jgi:hypothetical protein